MARSIRAEQAVRVDVATSTKITQAVGCPSSNMAGNEPSRGEELASLLEALSPLLAQCALGAVVYLTVNAKLIFIC